MYYKILEGVTIEHLIPVLGGFLTAFGGLGAILFFLLFFAISILWIILPFAIFGIKPLLRDILLQLALINENIKKASVTDIQK